MTVAMLPSEFHVLGQRGPRFISAGPIVPVAATAR